VSPLSRRALLLGTLLAPALAPAREATRRPLVFPRDHGAHPEFGIEWWYATGWLREGAADGAPQFGFQLTFFRSATGLAEGVASRFAARQLLFAHAALSDLGARKLVHAERIARWNGQLAAPQAHASIEDTRVRLDAWRFERDASAGYRATLADENAGFGFTLTLAPTQPLLLQGDGGFSRKGPREANASHYYSQPQLAVTGELAQGTAPARRVAGRAWLDHEWSGSLMPEGALGWDWIGINLADSGALTAFRLRDAQGGAVWAGGSHRATGGGAVRAFRSDEVRFEPLAWWTSAATGARYPVRWAVDCPAGRFEVRALLDAQELDSRGSTGSVYWEGLSELLADGRRAGLGYLEMTGYAGALLLRG
jgi:predicted secreted hydrolase